MKTTRLVKQLNNWFLDVIPKEFDMTDDTITVNYVKI